MRLMVEAGFDMVFIGIETPDDAGLAECNKQVLAKAKALGLTAARVASSSLDKITAEYLEIEILKDPELAAPRPLAPPPAPPAPPLSSTHSCPAVPRSCAAAASEVETAQKPEVRPLRPGSTRRSRCPGAGGAEPRLAQTPPPSAAARGHSVAAGTRARAGAGAAPAASAAAAAAARPQGGR